MFLSLCVIFIMDGIPMTFMIQCRPIMVCVIICSIQYVHGTNNIIIEIESQYLSQAI